MDQPIFNKNKLVYQSLAGYNTAFTKYYLCLENNGTDCETLSTRLDNSFNELNNNITDLYTLLSARKVDNTDVKEIYKKNNDLRKGLASQLEELYKYKGSVRTDTDIISGNLDSSMYIGLVWTTMATACLYYIFVKL